MFIRCVCGLNPEWLRATIDPISGYPEFPKCEFCGYEAVIDANTKIAHCWGANCNSNPIYRLGFEDGMYGHYCSACGRTLRQHPFFGQNRVYDKGNPASWKSWLTLTPQQKIEVYRVNGFRAPKRLLDLLPAVNPDPPSAIHPAQY